MAALLWVVGRPTVVTILRISTATWFLTILLFTPLFRAGYLLEPGLIGNDVSNYLAAGQRLNDGHDLYQLVDGDRPVPFYPPQVTVPLISPPPIAVVWRPLALLPEELAIRAWWLGGLILTTLATLWVIRRGSVLALGLIAAVSLDIAWTAWSGNVNAYVVPALVAAWAWQIRRPAIAGVLVGLAAVGRLTPIIIGWWGMALGRVRLVAAMGGTVFLAAVFSTLGAGAANHVAWLDVARHTAGIGASQPSFVGFVRDLGVDPALAAVLSPVSVIVGAVAVYLLRRRPAISWSAAIAVSVVASPVWHDGSIALLLAIAAATSPPLTALQPAAVSQTAPVRARGTFPVEG